VLGARQWSGRRVEPHNVNKMLLEIGAACAAYQDAAFRNLDIKRIEADEI
jgi:hypothetical protein